MWEIKNNEQIFSFAASCLFGFIYCLLYDIFRSCRRVKKYSTAAVFFQDVFFFCIISVTTFLLLLAFCNGEIRGYIFFGILLGAVICSITVSRIWIPILTFIFKKIIWLFSKLKWLFQVVWTYFYRIGLQVLKNCKKIFKKTRKYLKNILKQRT